MYAHVFSQGMVYNAFTLHGSHFLSLVSTVASPITSEEGAAPAHRLRSATLMCPAGIDPEEATEEQRKDFHCAFRRFYLTNCVFVDCSSVVFLFFFAVSCSQTP